MCEEGERALDKMMAALPHGKGKARHKGFYMQVFGRLPTCYRVALRRYLRLVLVTIMLPAVAQPTSLVSLPKPISGFRPITLMHDLAAFIEATVSDFLQVAVEKTKILGKFIAAYRPDMSGTQLITILLCGIEDASEFGRTLICGMEDFEKFYDACSTAIIMMAMAACGFSEKGYMQWAGESLRKRTMHVLTNIGVTAAVLRDCGFLQGSALSCILVNFVIKILHDMWAVDSDKEGYSGYNMEFNEVLKFLAIGFSDDNNVFSGTLVGAVRAVRTFGQFTVITAIGRSAKQAHATLFGRKVDPDKELLEASEETKSILRRHLRYKGSTWFIRSLAWSRQANNGAGCVVWTEIPLIREPRPYGYQDAGGTRHLPTQPQRRAAGKGSGHTGGQGPEGKGHWQEVRGAEGQCR